MWRLTLNDLPKTSLIWRISVRPAGLSCKISVIWCTVYKTSHVSLREEGQVCDFPGSEARKGRTPRLLEQVHDAVRRLHYSRRTEEAYVHWIKRFIYWSGRRHPATLGEAEVTAFLSHLAAERNVAAATQNQALAALLFLYKQVLDRDLGWFDDLVRAKRPVRVPVVLSRGEVKALLAQLRGTPRLMASLLYGGGLRVVEGLPVRGEGVGFSYLPDLVRAGEGAEDLGTKLPGA